MLSFSELKTKIKEKQANFKLSRSGSELGMAFFESIHFVPAIWDTLVGSQNVYLTSSYLKAIEDQMENQLSFRYILFYKGKKAVAMASFQLIDLDEDTIDFGSDSKRKKLGGKLVDQLGIRCLINGTLFGSGETSFYFSDDVSADEAFQALAVGTQKLYLKEKHEGKVDLLLIKDYFPESVAVSDMLLKYNYRDFKIEPNMVIKLQEDWNSFDDYLSAMLSKYRNRAKSAYKKSKNLIEKDLDKNKIRELTPRIRALFEAVHNKASFKMGLLDVAAFARLKENLQEQFVLKGYFLDDKLVGFSSIFIHNHTLDANYVGLDYDYNKSHAIYQRILYDLVKTAFDHNVKRINLGRTAGEIKSNLGATAVDMKCYIRHRNSLSNKIIKPFVKQITTPEFTERNPFKS